jgi:hypothetical protein
MVYDKVLEVLKTLPSSDKINLVISLLNRYDAFTGNENVELKNNLTGFRNAVIEWEQDPERNKSKELLQRVSRLEKGLDDIIQHMNIVAKDTPSVVRTMAYKAKGFN